MLCIIFAPIHNHPKCRSENEKRDRHLKKIQKSSNIALRPFYDQKTLQLDTKHINALPYIVLKVLIIFFCKMRTVKQCNVIKIQKLTSRPKIKLEMTFDLFATFFVNKLLKTYVPINAIYRPF